MPRYNQDGSEPIDRDAPDPRPWWEQPRPAWWVGQWPPPLPTGAHYGDNVGQIILDPSQKTTLDEGIAYGRENFGPATPTDTKTGTGGNGGTGGTGSTTGTAGDLLTAPFDPSKNVGAPSIAPTVNLGGPAGIPYIPPTPTFTAPTYAQAPAYTLPTLDEAMNEPGYQFGLQEGEKALEQSAAAKGALNTGGTLRDVLDYGRNAARQQYGDVVNRSLNTYLTNYKTQFADPNDYRYKAFLDTEVAPTLHAYDVQAQAGQRQNELDWQHLYDTWVQNWNIFRDQRDSTFNKRFTVATA